MPSSRRLPKTAFVVLGMHRSGTSAVAGSLAELGARPPSSLMPAKSDNPLGFWESERVVSFSDEILTAAGSHWQDWGPLDPAVFEGRFAGHFVAASQWLLQVEFGEAETIVLKDPRICRFYPFWRRALNASGFGPVVVLPVRAPDQVARSLHRRNGVPVSLGLRLWLRHVLDAEHASRDDPRHVATLEAFISHWPERFADLASCADIDLALADPEAVAGIDRFWARETQDTTAAPDEIALPPLVDRTWTAFRAMSETGDTPANRRVLDRLREEFETLSALFYDPPTPQ